MNLIYKLISGSKACCSLHRHDILLHIFVIRWGRPHFHDWFDAYCRHLFIFLCVLCIVVQIKEVIVLFRGLILNSLFHHEVIYVLLINELLRAHHL